MPSKERDKPAFDHQKLAAALSKAAGTRVSAPINCPSTTSSSPTRARQSGSPWIRQSGRAIWRTYACAKTDAAPPQSSGQDSENPRSGRRGRGSGRGRNASPDSPDGKWTALVKDNNVFLRAKDSNETTQLSTDGAEGNAYSLLSWSPDSTALVAWRVEPGDRKEVYLVRSSPQGGGRAVLETRPYALPGDKFPRYELNLFDVAGRKQTKPAVDRFEHEWERPSAALEPRRPPHRLRTGGPRPPAIAHRSRWTCTPAAVRTILEEKTETFIWTAHTENLRLERVNWLDKTDEIIYVSERDGWRHLYLVDAAKDGACNQITKGEWVVRGIDLIDEDARQIWFNAGGKNADQDPYFIHYYRVNFDGSGLVALTEGNGNHTVQYSPDRKLPDRHLQPRGLRRRCTSCAASRTASWSAPWKRRTSAS